LRYGRRCILPKNLDRTRVALQGPIEPREQRGRRTHRGDSGGGDDNLDQQTICDKCEDRVRGKGEKHAEAINDQRVLAALDQRPRRSGSQDSIVARHEPVANEGEHEEMDQADEIEVSLVDGINRVAERRSNEVDAPDF